MIELLEGSVFPVISIRGWVCSLHCKVAFRIVSCTPEPLPSASLQVLVEGLLVKDHHLLRFQIVACRRSRALTIHFSDEL